MAAMHGCNADGAAALSKQLEEQTKEAWSDLEDLSTLIQTFQSSDGAPDVRLSACYGLASSEQSDGGSNLAAGDVEDVQLLYESEAMATSSADSDASAVPSPTSLPIPPSAFSTFLAGEATNPRLTDVLQGTCRFLISRTPRFATGASADLKGGQLCCGPDSLKPKP
jgi:hypothetical protein